MKVVRKTILDKIYKEINNDKENILRIELTNREFKDLLDLLRKSDSGEKVTKCSLNVVGCMRDECDGMIKYTPTGNLSGSYIVYAGVCIQTHVDYK